LIAARVERAPLQQVLERIALRPLGLVDTSFINRDDPTIARGYVDTGDRRLIDVTESDKANVNELSPSGGLVSTGADVMRFTRALFAGQLVSSASLELMKSGEGTLRHGLIADERGSPAFGHQGALIGESSWALFFPEADAVVVVMVNSDGAADDVVFMRRFLD